MKNRHSKHDHGHVEVSAPAPWVDPATTVSLDAANIRVAAHYFEKGGSENTQFARRILGIES